MMHRQAISVSALSNYIKNIFDAESLLYNISVVGEISSFANSGGNLYFAIKDENALLNCVMFGADLQEQFRIGDKVIVTGTPRYYAKGGRLNFNAVDLQLYGEGEMYKRFLQLKSKLESEGLFDPLHKLAMPKKIARIGVVTSETGAVIHDIINVATRRNAAQDIVLYPIKVQGIGADVEIARGIDFFAQYDNIDAIIVGRGGGSEEDLAPFNSEVVARAVYRCNKFVVSAVGHETDNTICDLVADLRAPTPSAAAELLTKDGADRRQMLNMLWKNIDESISTSVFNKSAKLENLTMLLNQHMQNRASQIEQQKAMIKLKIDNLNPLQILKKGYAKLEAQNCALTSTNNIKAGDNISIYLQDGKISANVIEVKNGL